MHRLIPQYIRGYAMLIPLSSCPGFRKHGCCHSRWFFSSSAGIQQWEDPVDAGASWLETTIDSLVVQEESSKVHDGMTNGRFQTSFRG